MARDNFGGRDKAAPVAPSSVSETTADTTASAAPEVAIKADDEGAQSSDSPAVDGEPTAKTAFQFAMEHQKPVPAGLSVRDALLVQVENEELFLAAASVDIRFARIATDAAVDEVKKSQALTQAAQVILAEKRDIYTRACDLQAQQQTKIAHLKNKLASMR